MEQRVSDEILDRVCKEIDVGGAKDLFTDEMVFLDLRDCRAEISALRARVREMEGAKKCGFKDPGGDAKGSMEILCQLEQGHATPWHENFDQQIMYKWRPALPSPLNPEMEGT
jgi:hypothetical protein